MPRFFNLGGTGQVQMNEQRVDTADIVLAVFDARLGSPAAVAISGTAEEIFRAHDACKPMHVWFSREGLPREIDVDQVRRVQEFERTLRSQGLHVSFDSPEDLANKVRDAVELYIERLQALGSLPRLSALPSRDDFARLQDAFLHAESGTANADAKVVEIAGALLTFTESMSPVLRGLTEI